MKPMSYNRTLDYVALGLRELTANKNPVLAARLFAKAAAQGDVDAAIRTIEATNRFAHAQAVKAAAASKPLKPVKAAEELMPTDGEVCEEPVEAEFGEDPLDDVEEEEEEAAPPAPAPAMAAKQMASVLSKMQRRRDGK